MVHHYVFGCCAFNYFILNLILGLLVHFFDYSEPIWWHALSPYFIALLLFIMVWSVVTELYILRKGGHSLAKQLKARRLVKGESTPEEHAALKLQNIWHKHFP